MRKAELIVALDVPSFEDVPAIVKTLGAHVTFYKVGLELFTATGPRVMQYLADQGKQTFLDLKLHDIPRTVANAVKTASAHGASLLTVHASGGRDMLSAAAQAAAEMGEKAPIIVAVTVLTSLNNTDLTEMNVSKSVTEHALSLGKMAISSGIDGLVCSPLEISHFREAIGTDPILVTPGIRPAGADVGDQKRVATPAMAVRDGSSFLVVGRPILQAEDPAAAAQAIREQMAAAERRGRE